MVSHAAAARRLHPADAVFGVFLIAYAAASVSLIPYDFTDLCYLFSLERGTWVPQEWMHPIYVPTLRVLSVLVGAFGYHGHMLVPVELMNVAAASIAWVLLYRLARRIAGPSLAAVVALFIAATSTGFWSAAMRSTPYALALLCQVISLSLLISDRPASPIRYVLAGAFAGLAMGYHAAAMALGVAGLACALFEPDPGRTRRGTVTRIAGFGAAMLAVAITSWAVFITYNGLDTRYFRDLDFHSTFLSIEQVPNTSIYTSGSGSSQLSSFAASVSFQAGALVRAAVVVLVLALATRLWTRRPLAPAERRLAIVTAANFAGIAGFFLINNTHNGFIFASVTLFPVMIGAAIGRSWIGLAVVTLLALSSASGNITKVMQSGGASDPQLVEVRFLEQSLSDRDVLLTPGTPFAEVLYLSHLNVFEIAAGDASHWGGEVPVLHPGEALRARIAWWLGNGSRVVYALGDESTDFTGDVVGAEKEHQIFWRNETAAHERAPVLRELRAALERSGIEMRETRVSPHGNRYVEIGVTVPTPRTAPSPVVASGQTSRELRRLLLGVPTAPDDPLPGQIRFLTTLEDAIPDDPWLVCDWMALTCDRGVTYDGKGVACRPLPGCDERIGLQVASSASEPYPHHGGPTGRHLTPAIGQMVHDAAADALQPILRAGFTVKNVDVGRDTIELSIRDAQHAEYAVTLALLDSKRDAPPDGKGRNFIFYLAPAANGANPAASSLLLAAAARFDEAIPDAALRSD